MLNVSLPPHITSRYRLKQRQVRRMAASAPLVISALYLFGKDYLYSLLAGLAGFVILPLIIKKWRRNDLDLAGAFFSGALVSLLMPAGSAWYLPFLAGAMISGGKNILSEKDRLAPINLTALVMALFILVTPDGIEPAYSWGTNNWGWGRGNFYFMTGWIPLAGCLLLLMMLVGRLYKIRVFVFSLLAAGAALWLGWQMTGTQPDHLLSRAGLQALLFLAGILAAEDHYAPMTSWGQAVYGLLAGTLFSLFAMKDLLYQGLVFSALTASLFTPFLDCLFTGGYRRTKA